MYVKIKTNFKMLICKNIRLQLQLSNKKQTIY